MGRREALSVSSGWTPADLRPAAWYYADSAYVTLSGSSVTAFADRSGNGNTLGQVTPALYPQWDTTGWGGRKPAIYMSGGQSLSANDGSVLNGVNGLNVPMGVLATYMLPTAADHESAICSWVGGVAQMVAQTSSGTPTRLVFSRTDDAGSSVTRTGSVTIPLDAHQRAMFLFTGSTINAYVGSALDISASASLAGPSAYTLFRVGDGPGGSDAADMWLTELVVVVGRVPSAAEALAYYAYSLAEWG